MNEMLAASRITSRPINSTGKYGNTLAVQSDKPLGQTNQMGVPIAMPTVTPQPAVLSYAAGVAAVPTLSPMFTNLEDALTVTMDNSGGGGTVNYLVFDPAGLYAAYVAGTTKAYLNGSSGIDTAICNALAGSGQMAFKGFTYQVTNFNTSLGVNIKGVQIDFNGNKLETSINPGSYIRNSQYLGNVQSFDSTTPFIAYYGYAMIVPVPAGEIGKLYLFPQIAYGRSWGTN